MRRVVRRVVLPLLVLLLLLTGVVTWVFSSQIRSAALEVDPAQPSYDVRVVSVDPPSQGGTGDGSITLDDADAHRPQLHQPIRYGLRWEGGAGFVDGPVSVVKGHEVTRSFTVLEGSPPESGAEVDPFREVYDDAASVPGMDLREVAYDADGHTFPAFVAEPADGTDSTDSTDSDPGRWAVLVHGKGSTPLEMARMAQPMVEAGRTVMLIGYRNDEGSWQDPSGRYGYGTTEWKDLRNALVWARDQGARDVVLGGASMGGAVVASYLERIPDHQGITGAVLDSPMLDLDATISWGARDETLPGGLPLPEALTWAAKRVAGLRFDVDWDATDYVDDTGWADVPVLVLHGDADPTVPIASSRELAEADDDVTLEEFAGARHVESWNRGRARYDQLVRAFASSPS